MTDDKSPLKIPTNPQKSLALSIKSKVAYGLGGMTEFLFTVPNPLYLPVYSKQLGMDTGLLGIATALPKIIAAFADSIIGGWSDNCRSRWGRRKPFMLVGCLLGIVLLPFLWTPPSQAGNVGLFIYLTLISIPIAIFQSMYSVPYQALGFELSNDYDEQTNIQAWKGYIVGISIFLAPWLFWICSRDCFANLAEGARTVSLFVGLLMLVCTIIAIKYSPERVESVRNPTMPLMQALKITFANRPFILLQMATLLTFLSVCCGVSIGFYLMLDYVCQGDEKLFGLVTGISGNVANVMTYIGLTLGVWLSSRTSKKTTALVGIGFIMLGILLLFPFLNPQMPWLTFLNPEHHVWLTMIPGIPMNLGMQCCSLVFASMMADVCAEDEILTGLRREGAYAAVAGFLNKAMTICLFACAGFMPHLTGYVNMSIKPTLEQLQSMKSLLIGFQGGFAILALLFICAYPITRERANKNRLILESKKRS